ncbi:MAG: DNA double-strand break repair nuclease NurA [Anaerolineae bacterium]|nr:MAG: DNA double-strand break repair nuclease NurA [Anaerolineae bacterium]
MSLDFQQVRDQVKALGEHAPLREQKLRDLQKQAAGLLETHAKKLDELREKVGRAATANQTLRCALPFRDALNHHIALPAMPQQATIIAADGSQINPDRHAETEYCLVNVGSIRTHIGEKDAPEQTIKSDLFYDPDIYTDNGLLTEAQVALIRDMREREVLVTLAAGQPEPVLTFTDGPLELWSRDDAVLDSKNFARYLETLSALNIMGAATAGYVDKPGSGLLVSLLEVAALPEGKLGEAGKDHWLRGITDAGLLSGVLAPGERSAVFGIQSKTASRYQDALALHFFYLNVSMKDDFPWLVRVEVPGWVANHIGMLDSLHAVLVRQCQVAGNIPYPYLLHRAHEIAVVTRDEKEQLERMITQELYKNGVRPGWASAKGRMKQTQRR